MLFFGKHFLGRWMDEYGKIIVVRKGKKGYLVDFYTDYRLNPAIRTSPEGGNSKSLDMKAYVRNKNLVVELGNSVSGPTLVLKRETFHLRPSIYMGINGHLEDDFGVPWILPLSLYLKVG
ncbi:MAG: hypothetical protein ACM3WV_01360 [Bacillota bacterium]